jgi:hypothetical protein
MSRPFHAHAVLVSAGQVRGVMEAAHRNIGFTGERR